MFQESCRENAAQRKVQFKLAMEKLGTYSNDPNTFSIVGGDLNIRDVEVSFLLLEYFSRSFR
jgi:hypothetical protein